jgi:hypothetical protein
MVEFFLQQKPYWGVSVASGHCAGTGYLYVVVQKETVGRTGKPLSLHQQTGARFPAFEAVKKAAVKVRQTVKGRYLAAGVCALLLVSALADYLISGLARRTFVFHVSDTGQEIVEERMIKKTSSREADIDRYVEEALLGPLSPETDPMLGRDVRPEALLLKDGIVFLSVSMEAALQAERFWDNLANLRRGIRRNFPFVTDVRFFIGGKEMLFNRPGHADK